MQDLSLVPALLNRTFEGKWKTVRRESTGIRAVGCWCFSGRKLLFRCEQQDSVAGLLPEKDGSNQGLKTFAAVLHGGTKDMLVRQSLQHMAQGIQFRAAWFKCP